MVGVKFAGVYSSLPKLHLNVVHNSLNISYMHTGSVGNFALSQLPRIGIPCMNGIPVQNAGNMAFN